MLKRVQLFAISALVLNGVAHADNAGDKVWTGEGAFSAGFTSGNTETTDISLGVKLARDLGKWAVSGNASGELGKTDGVESRNRQSLSAIADRQLNDKWSVFVKGNSVQDAFSGFKNRAFLGSGLGYEAINTDKTQLKLRGALGVQYDKTRGSGSVLSESTSSFGANGGYDFGYTVNDKVKYSSGGEVFYSEVSTQFVSANALTAELGGGFSGRASVELRYDTEPPAGFESTDTTTRFSLVYGF